MIQQDDIVISGLTIHTEQSTIPDSSVWVSQGKIREISPPISNVHGQHFRFPANYHLVPGRIDMHIHGAGGADFMDASFESLSQIRKTLAIEGTTGFLATTVSESPEKIQRALKNLNHYQQLGDLGAEILGVHLEGPFISKRQNGAHRPETLLFPDIQLFDAWQACSGNQIKLVTLAPELPQALDFIHHLRQQGVIAAVGHTDADFSTTELAIAAGASHATHLFNAMRGFHHRNPGCVGAILLNPQVIAELIIDGHHLHPAALNLALQTKGLAALVLVTDGMRAKCCEEGTFELGGQTVIVEKGAARLNNGTLAGSVLTMSQAVKNLLIFTDCSLHDSITLTSINPAKSLNIFDRKGSIAPGKDADLVVIDEQYNVVLTICQGNVIYQK